MYCLTSAVRKIIQTNLDAFFYKMKGVKVICLVVLFDLGGPGVWMEHVVLDGGVPQLFHGVPPRLHHLVHHPGILSLYLLTQKGRVNISRRAWRDPLTMYGESPRILDEAIPLCDHLQLEAGSI